MRQAKPIGSWLLTLSLVLAGCNVGGEPPTLSPASEQDPNVVHVSAEALQEIAVEEVHGQPLAEAPTFSGRVQYSLNGFAKIGTPLVGIVKSVPAHLGDRVKAGQTLVTIESADIGMAYSDFAKAESDLQLTQRYLELSKDLYESKSISKKDFDQAQNDFNKAEAEFTRARQRLLTLRVPAS